MSKERRTSISGWHIIHDFFHGWGLMEPNHERTIWGGELRKHGLDFYTSTLEEIEAAWPAVQEARDKEAARIAKLPKPDFKSFTFPNIKGSPQFNTSPLSEILSVQPMKVDKEADIKLRKKFFMLPKDEESSDG